ncbi:MAG: hypothetical protein ACR2M2_03395, partial [Gaiellaceae bacterium]
MSSNATAAIERRSCSIRTAGRGIFRSPSGRISRRRGGGIDPSPEAEGDVVPSLPAGGRSRPIGGKPFGRTGDLLGSDAETDARRGAA